jgi:hypothetical protein
MGLVEFRAYLAPKDTMRGMVAGWHNGARERWAGSERGLPCQMLRVSLAAAIAVAGAFVAVLICAPSAGSALHGASSLGKVPRSA